MHDNENHAALGWKALIKFAVGTLAMFLVVYVSTPHQVRSEDGVQPQRLIGMAIEQAIENINAAVTFKNNKPIRDRYAYREATFEAFKIIQRFPDEISGEQFTFVARALNNIRLFKETIELSNLGLEYDFTFDERWSLLLSKAYAFSTRRRWDHARSTYDLALQLVKDNEANFQNPEQLLDLYLPIYRGWIAVERDSKQCDTAIRLYDEMTTSYWYLQLGEDTLNELQRFNYVMENSIAFSCKST